MEQSGNVYYVDFTLTAEQRRFKSMLSKYPRLLAFWNFGTRECDIENLERNWGNFSSDEREMARFFVSMWQPGNLLDFDVMHAIGKLDDCHWQVIEQWMATLEHPDIVSRMMVGG